MKLKNLRKTEIWKFDITEPLQYDDHIVGEIEITFMNGKFVGIDWPFRDRYTLEQLDIIAEAIAKAHEIDCQYSDPA